MGRFIASQQFVKQQGELYENQNNIVITDRPVVFTDTDGWQHDHQ